MPTTTTQAPSVEALRGHLESAAGFYDSLEQLANALDIVAARMDCTTNENDLRRLKSRTNQPKGRQEIYIHPVIYHANAARFLTIRAAWQRLTDGAYAVELDTF